MCHLVRFSKIDECGLIVVSNPPVNALNPEIVKEIRSSLKSAEEDNSIKAVILTSMGRTFIAGADINEFRNPRSSRKRRESLLYPLLLSLEDCRKPVICAIHGTALGGGLEIAMACHYRIAAALAQVGLPEVKLGLIPGGGGTQRLPRLAGVAKAAEMCSEGNSISAAEAFESGIVDRIIEEELLPGTLSFAWERIAENGVSRKTRELTDKLGNNSENEPVLVAAREKARRQSRGRIAPLRAIDAVEAATKLSFERGCLRENELFNECFHSAQSKALIHLFFAEREVSKVPGIRKDTPVTLIKRAAVVGAGNMGAGIAMCYANAGIPVLLKDVAQELIERALSTIRKNYESSVKRGRVKRSYADGCMQLIQPTRTYRDFAGVDIVTEAVYEDMPLKKQVFAELTEVCKPEAILATNTSTLDVDEIASAADNPSRVVGHHFFAPANVMQLIEIVRGKETAPGVIASSMALARKLKKTGVVVGNCRGFAGNRMYYQYQREAQFLVEEGARVEQVDAALYEFGMAMGPFATRDLSGLDVAWRIQKQFGEAGPEDSRRPLVIGRLYELGRFGQKTGAGWYRYDSEGRKPLPDPEVQKIIEECACTSGIRRRSVSPAEILERTLYAVVNEGARILEEGIASRSLALDIIFVTGYGFPAHIGGPMWFADCVGLKAIYNRICDFHRQYSAHWSPAPLLKRLADQARTFADFDRAFSPNPDSSDLPVLSF
jgi:3-hydroxyacyl-CoA dehydrogenase